MNVAPLFYLGNTFPCRARFASFKGCMPGANAKDYRRLQKTWLNTSSYLGRLPEFDVGSPEEMTPNTESPGGGSFQGTAQCG